MKRFAILVSLLAACGDDASRADIATSVDSMGVTVVTSTMPGWGEAPRWRLDTIPELVIGGADRTPSVLLVGVSSVLRVGNDLVASTNDDKRIRWFRPGGEEYQSVGGQGTDAGRFGSVRIAGLLGDSLLTWDEQLDRATVLAPDARAVRTFHPVADTVLARFGFTITATFDDGTLLAASRSGALSGGVSGLRRDTIAVARLDREGGGATLLAEVPGHENVVVSGADFVTLVPRPFGARTVVGTHGNDLLIGLGDRDEVRRYRNDGTLLGIYRLDRPRRLIPATDLAAQREQFAAQLAQLPLAMADAIAAALAEAGAAAVYPAHDQLLVDETGAIWLREDIGPRRGREEPRRWVILGADGVWHGTITTPARFEVHQVTADRVIGVWRDDFDVEHLRIHRLER
jgi:hypothetical protein